MKQLEGKVAIVTGAGLVGTPEFLEYLGIGVKQGDTLRRRVGRVKLRNLKFCVRAVWFVSVESNTREHNSQVDLCLPRKRRAIQFASELESLV
mgnify:CR=1 FL=1